MILVFIAFLVGLTIFLSVKFRKVIQGGRKYAETTKEGEPKESLVNRLNLFQKWNAKRIAKWVFGIFLVFELVVLGFDSSDLSLIRMIVSIARKNDADFQVKRVTQNKIAAETQKDREELSKIHDNVEEAEELRQKIKDTEARYDPSKKPLQPQRRLSNALRGEVYMNDHEGSAQAKIVFLDDVQLVVRYAYHCGTGVYVGKFEGEWNKQQQQYVGRYTDTKERGVMELKPFTDLPEGTGEIYRFDGKYKGEGGDKWISVTITHQEGIGTTHNCSTKS